jgi:hypothetical protein
MRLFRMVAIALLAAPPCVPADMPKGLFHGQMVSWEGSPTKGVLLARTAAGIVEGCGYDALSILQLSRQRVTVAKLEAGDPLEIITDHKPGVIIRQDARSITLRTRAGEQTLLLRKDTRYLGDGARQDATAVLVNTRVFVRAGANLYGGIEAYQVMWGDIMEVQ